MCPGVQVRCSIAVFICCKVWIRVEQKKNVLILVIFSITDEEFTLFSLFCHVLLRIKNSMKVLNVFSVMYFQGKGVDVFQQESSKR